MTPGSRARVLVLVAQAVVAIGAVVMLWVNLGASLTEVRLLLAWWLGGWGLLVGWAWWKYRLSLYHLEALFGLVAGAILLYGGGLDLAVLKWVFAGFWVVVVALEVTAAGGGDGLLSPWGMAATAMAAVVTITFPSALVVEFAALASVWAAVVGLLVLTRGLALARASRPPAAPRGRLRRAVSVGIPGLVFVLVALGFGQVMANTAAADARQRVLAPFYEVPPDLAPGEPGSVIRSTQVEFDGLDGRAFRVLYRTEDEFARPTVSSGLIFAPREAGSNHPVIAWAHGTVGLGEVCAPSRDGDFLRHTSWINDALARGFVVAATDYAGAGGTGNGEKYMVLAEQGRDVVNSVRAALDLPETGAGPTYATYGESQGGAVSLAAAALSPAYAPELELIAAGGVAAASDLAAILSQKWDRPLATWLLGPHILRAYTRHYPHLKVDEILTEAGRNHYVEIADDSCVFDLLGALLNPQMGRLLTRDPTTDPDWNAALVANQAPDPPPGLPVFAGHGLADPLIDPGITAALVERYCAAGSAVNTHWMEGVEHIGSSNDGAPAYLDWLGAIQRDEQPANHCGEPLPVPPVTAP